MKSTISLFTGFLLLSLLFNPVKGILDIPHQSCMFVCVVFSLAIGALALFPINRLAGRLTNIDRIIIILIVGNIFFYPPTFNLFSLARFSLAIIYWGIRCTGGLNVAITYGSILITIFVLSILGYLQMLHILPSCHPYFEITGPYGNPTIYAGVLSLLLCAPIVTLSHFKTNTTSRYVYLLSLLVCIAALPILWFTNCRSAWIAILAVAGYLVYRRFSISFRWGIFALLLTVLLSSWLYQFKPASANGRILIWKVTARMIKEKPIFGYGPHGFTANYMQFQGDYLKKEGSIDDKRLADNNHYVYNEPLRWTVEYGIGGLILYLVLFYAIVRYKEKEISSLSSKMICMAGLIWGFFSYPDQVLPVLIIMVIALAEMSNRQKECIIKRLPHPIALTKTVVLLAMVGQGLLLIKTYRCHRELYQISKDTPNQSPEKVIASLSLLETSMKNDATFWAYYCHTLDKYQKDTILLEKITHWEQLYPSTHTYILKGDALQRKGKLKEAEVAYWTAHFMVPSRQKARYKLALLYHSQRRIPEAIRLANELLTEKVKVYGFETYEMHKELKRIFENQLK